MERSRLLALLAPSVRAVVRVPLPPQPIEARLVVRELPEELHDRVRGLGSRASERVVAVYLGHIWSVSDFRTYVKGILAHSLKQLHFSKPCRSNCRTAR